MRSFCVTVELLVLGTLHLYLITYKLGKFNRLWTIPKSKNYYQKL